MEAINNKKKRMDECLLLFYAKTSELVMKLGKQTGEDLDNSNAKFYVDILTGSEITRVKLRGAVSV